MGTKRLFDQIALPSSNTEKHLSQRLMSTIVFSLPELVDAIAVYLDRTDIACCLRINRLLFDAFTPRLWRHVTLSNYTYYLPGLFPVLASATSAASYGTFRCTPPLSGLIRNSHLIQTVTIDWQDKLEVHNYCLPKLFPQREDEPSLFFSWPEDPSEVLYHERVRRLYPCPGQVFSNEVAKEQKQLRFHGYKMLPGHLQAAVFAAVLEKIGRAREMYQTWQQSCPRGLIRRWTSLSIISKETINPVSAPSGPCSFGHNQRYLYRCSQIIRDMAMAFVLQAAVRATTTTVEAAIDLTTPNPFLMGDSNVQEQGDRCSLEDLTIARCDGFGAISVLALIQSPGLAQSLKRLDILGCSNFQSEEMHVLLESMPHLKEVDFRARNEMTMRYAVIAPRIRMYGTGSDNPQGEYFSEKQATFLNRLMMDQRRRQAADLETIERYTVAQEEMATSIKVLGSTKGVWPCASSLQVLRIGVNNSYTTDKTGPFDPIYYPGGEGNPSCKTCPGEYQWFYELLAPLTNLRELCLVGGHLEWEQQCPLQIDVKHGLDLWRGLTSMQVLDIEGLILHWAEMEDGRHHEAEDVDQTRSVDVQWMEKHWTRLRRIKGLWYRHQMTEANPEFMPESVQWLQKNRPEIEVPLSLWPREVSNAETEEEDRYIRCILGL